MPTKLISTPRFITKDAVISHNQNCADENDRAEHDGADALDEVQHDVLPRHSGDWRDTRVMP